MAGTGDKEMAMTLSPAFEDLSVRSRSPALEQTPDRGSGRGSETAGLGAPVWAKPLWAERREEGKNLPDGGRAGAKVRQYRGCDASRERCRKEPKK